MQAKRVSKLDSSIQPGDHPYLTGAWAPITEEWNADALDVAGTIPRDLNGVYLRNTENPVHAPLGRYHPFDGDGMLCAIHFDHGSAAFRNRFVRTAGLRAEQAAGEALWSGIAQVPPLSKRPGWGAHGHLKDASSTDVVVHAGRALTSFYQCGDLYQFDPCSLEQYGAADWHGAFPADSVSAHAKLDRATGELLFFNYSTEAPYMRWGVVDDQNRLTHYAPVPLPGPRLPHDMAFTRRYAIFNDFPLFWDADMLQQGVHVARLHPELPSRFAVVDRPGGGEAIRWFEASPTYALHFVNAWEDGDAVVLDGFRQQCPIPPPLEGVRKRYAQLMALLDLDSIRPQLWRWRFNLRTGKCSEGALDDTVCEFGTCNRDYATTAHRYVYSALGESGRFLFNGLCKHDLRDGRVEQVAFGDGIYGSEASFAPRDGGQNEDDGYLVTFVTDINRDVSECWVYAAQDLAAGPLARIALPLRIPSGTHSYWAPADACVV